MQADGAHLVGRPIQSCCDAAGAANAASTVTTSSSRFT